MIDFNIIATGSTGNATVINGHILIDCGISFKKLRPYIRELNLVLLTHVHGDHFKESTVRELHRLRPQIRFGCCPWMVEPLLQAGVDQRKIDVYEPGKGQYTYGSGQDKFAVYPFALVHNVPNCGYIVSTLSEAMMYATDTGNLDMIEAKNLDLYLIEANHGEDEIQARIEAKLEAGEMAYEAAAMENHLSREQALQWLSENMGPKSRYVFMHQHVDRGGPEECQNGITG